MAQSVAHTEAEAAPTAAAMRKAERLTPAEMAERLRAELLENAGPGAGAAPAAMEAIGAVQIAERAKTELARVTGLDADHVSGVLPGADGWHVTVDLIELRRIPASTDVLAAYEAVFAPTGVLMSYHRTRRYFRDQMMDQS